MKNDMSIIMENWRKSINPLDPLYAQNVLGIKIPLVEGKFFISEDLKKDILQEQLLLENFFSKIANFAGDKIQSFKEDVFKKFGNLGNLFKTIWSVVTDPKQIGTFRPAIDKKGVKPIKKTLKSFITKLKDLNMNKLAIQIENIQKKIVEATSLTGWKGAVSHIGITLLWNYVEGAIGEIIGKKIDAANPIGKFIENVKPEIFNKIQTYFTDTFPNLAAQLYGKAAFAASGGALGWMAIAYKIFEAASWVADSLASTLKRFQYSGNIISKFTDKT
jgi:hypothetical protein